MSTSAVSLDLQFLGLEKVPQMPQLPCARHEQRHQLSDTPPHRSRIGLLTQRPELGLSFPLELLLPSDVGQARVQVAHLASQVLDVLSFTFLVHFGFADCDVKVHTHLRS